jgi:hypothetical protein
MPTDLDQQLARFAEALDREAPTISLDDMVGRGAVAVDVDRLASSDRASLVDDVPSIDTTPGDGEVAEREALIELAPALVVRQGWGRTALKVALAAAAVVLLVVALTAIERGGDEPGPAVDFPDLTTTFVSPRNGFAVDYPDRGDGTVTPAKQLLGFSPQVDDGFDVVETGLAAVFKGASTELSAAHRPPGVSQEQEIDETLSEDSVLPDGCGVPRSQQAQITIDGQSGRIAECANRIEATVVDGGRLYVFTLSHDRSDARAVFDAFLATIDLTPETAIDYPAMTTTFVSPTYGYSFNYHDRGGLAPATGVWDPVHEQVDYTQFDDRFDAVETGLAAYFVGASTAIPEGVSIDAWVDEHISLGACGVQRSRQAVITIDGQQGRVAECANRIEATVVDGGRLYLFTLLHDRSDARAWFDAWTATIDLTPGSAAAP